MTDRKQRNKGRNNSRGVHCRNKENNRFWAVKNKKHKQIKN